MYRPKGIYYCHFPGLPLLITLDGKNKRGKKKHTATMIRTRGCLRLDIRQANEHRGVIVIEQANYSAAYGSPLHDF